MEGHVIYGQHELSKKYVEYSIELTEKFEELIDVTSLLDSGIIYDEEVREEYADRFTHLVSELHVPQMFQSIAMVNNKIRVYV